MNPIRRYALYTSMLVLFLAACQPIAPPSRPVAPPPATRTDAGTSEPADAPADVATPIEVTYFTPRQAEGPYYPVEKPTETDNDLTAIAGASSPPEGQVLAFSGHLYDATGMPVADAVIEIWQTDSNGIYLHPGDPQTEQRDRNFQFYGEAVTAADGGYDFRTILPGQYEPRPRHIHVKVKRDDQELLTTQIYFEGDAELQADGIFLSGGSENEHLVMSLTRAQDASEGDILTGQHDIVLEALIQTES